MTPIGKPGLMCTAISIVISVMVMTGSDRSPKLYCSQSEDSQAYEGTGITLKKLMKRLDENKISYKYDEQTKVLQLQQGANIYFKDHASGLAAYKATQHIEKTESFGITLAPGGEAVMNPCKLIELMAREPKKKK
jgi:hypothetical protein